MTTEEVLAYSLAKPWAYLEHPFGPDSCCVKVGPEEGPRRIFVQLFSLGGEACATFTCDSAAGELYRNAYPGEVVRGYHCPPVQQPFFNTVRLSSSVPDEVILAMVDHAHAVAASKLPKRARVKLVP